MAQELRSNELSVTAVATPQQLLAPTSLIQTNIKELSFFNIHTSDVVFYIYVDTIGNSWVPITRRYKITLASEQSYDFDQRNIILEGSESATIAIECDVANVLNVYVSYTEHSS